MANALVSPKFMLGDQIVMDMREVALMTLGNDGELQIVFKGITVPTVLSNVGLSRQIFDHFKAWADRQDCTP